MTNLLDWLSKVTGTKQRNSGDGAVQVGPVKGNVTVHVTQFVVQPADHKDCATCVLRGYHAVESKEVRR